MRKDSHIVTAGDVPPVNYEDRPTQCGWCKSVIGEEHGADCPKRERTIVGKLVAEFVMEVPESFDEERIEYLWNGNRICATEIVHRLSSADPCLCGGFSMVREATAEDEERLPWARG